MERERTADLPKLGTCLEEDSEGEEYAEDAKILSQRSLEV
jgi:hypothetical protein